MPDVSPLVAWESFYVIVGSSSAALTGLVFVVVSLIPESVRRSGTTEGPLAAFAAPTVSHLVAGLLVSAIMSAPWGAVRQAGVAVALSGIVGAVYCAVVFRRIRRQTAYRVVSEDWFWYLLLPLLAYAVLLIAGLALRGPGGPLFAIGGAVLLLLFIGIHNAWDVVTYAAHDAPPPPANPVA